MDMRLQHHLAQEFYRQQMLQRIPGNYLPFHLQVAGEQQQKAKRNFVFVYSRNITFGDGNPSTKQTKSLTRLRVGWLMTLLLGFRLISRLVSSMFVDLVVSFRHDSHESWLNISLWWTTKRFCNAQLQRFRSIYASRCWFFCCFMPWNGRSWKRALWVKFEMWKLIFQSMTRRGL